MSQVRDRACTACGRRYLAPRVKTVGQLPVRGRGGSPTVIGRTVHDTSLIGTVRKVAMIVDVDVDGIADWCSACEVFVRPFRFATSMGERAYGRCTDFATWDTSMD